MSRPALFSIVAFLFFWMAPPSFAFPPQSVEFLPGYKFPDSASNSAAAYQLRYFLYPYDSLGIGVGIGSIRAKANNINLALDSRLAIRPLTLAFKVIPFRRRTWTSYLEAGVDYYYPRPRYQLDPAVDTGAGDSCLTDLATGPSPCKITNFKKRHYGYRIGAGAEMVFKSGVGIGLDYAYLFAKPLERTISTTPNFGIDPISTVHEDLFKINESILSLLVSYHF